MDWVPKEGLQFESRGHQLEKFLFAQGKSVSVLLSPSTDGMRPTHITESSLLHSKSIELSVIHIQKIFSQKHAE